jgi:hypothetical protein
MTNVSHAIKHTTNFLTSKWIKCSMSTSPIFLSRCHLNMTIGITNLLNNPHAYGHYFFIDFHFFLNLNPKVNCVFQFCSKPLWTLFTQIFKITPSPMQLTTCPNNPLWFSNLLTHKLTQTNKMPTSHPNNPFYVFLAINGTWQTMNLDFHHFYSLFNS